MNRSFGSWAGLALVGLISFGCGGPLQSTPPNLKAPAVGPSPAITKDAWEQDWERIITEARKEGTVTIYTTWGADVRTALTSVVREKYGINLEFSPFSRGPELVAKVQTEHRAGLYLADAFGTGATTVFDVMKPAGLLGSAEPFLILPEVRNPKVWMGGQLPFLDKERTFIGLLAVKQRYLGYNTELIKRGELTGYRDLLSPQYRGRITMNDPTTTGIGAALMAHLAVDLWSPAEARAFLTQLVRHQEVVIQRDNRAHIESVARGKYAIGVGLNPDALNDFLKVGAPIDAVDIREGTLVTPGAGGIAVPTLLAHPNAAAVFLNWMLGKEGQTLFARSLGALSMRTDTPTEGINPIFLFQPGEKLFYHSEEKALAMGEWARISKQIIDEALK